ncbi:MAG: hypothetical protein LBS98_06375 [Coriobacteriales bacterium]|jgi:hypothetical protein|nr:hypothetical protein [Coriobacteriales bacterium]
MEPNKNRLSWFQNHKTTFLKKALSLALVVALMATLSLGSAFASGQHKEAEPQLPLAEQITFFNPTVETNSDVASPRYFSSLAGSYEQNTLEVDAVTRFAGGTITLENCASDGVFLGLFFMIEYDSFIHYDVFNNARFVSPEWYVLEHLRPEINLFISGVSAVNNPNVSKNNMMVETDMYLVNEKTIRVMARLPLPATDGKGASARIEVSNIPYFTEEQGSALHHDAKVVEYNLALDSIISSENILVAEPGVYGQDAKDAAEVEVIRLIASPSGAVISVAGNAKEGSRVNRGKLEYYMITDDFGNHIQAVPLDLQGETTREIDELSPAGNSVVSYVSCFDSATYQLIGIDPETTALSFTPLAGNEEERGVYELRTLEQIAVGDEIDTNPLGGFTVQQYYTSGNHATLILAPVGCQPFGVAPLFMPVEDDVSISKQGLSNVIINPTTGHLELTWDYYNSNADKDAKYTYTFFPNIAVDYAAQPVKIGLKPLV